MQGERIQYTIGFDADISAAKASMDSLQKTFSNFGVSSNFGEKINQEFAKFGKAYETYMSKINSGIKTKADFSAVTKNLNEMKSAMAGVAKEAVKIGNADPLKAFRNDKIMSGLLSQIDDVQKRISNFKFDPKSLGNISDVIKANISKSNTNIPNLLDQIQASNKAGNYDQTIAGLNKLQNAVALSKQRMEELAGEYKKGSAEAINYKTKADQLGQALEKIKNINPSNLAAMKTELEGLLTQASDRANTLSNSWQDFTGKVQQSQNVMAKTADSLQRIHKEEFGMQRQIEMVDRQIQSYFGLTQILRKVMNIARQAMGTVKELDKAMTETAVVTNFDVGDMWEKLPQYTAMANQLGATINDVYKATTLYYQQGLNMSQAMGIAEQTLKMARIGGIDAAEATNMMTAALRGFNMQINEMSAQKVNDVYSKVAAMSASNTKELGEAMERTASIANSAGMEFGNTTAFLAQMIETTREAPENLGTAMKTIIARFQEMKKNPAELIDVEGEMLDVNRVDKALKSVGIALTDTEGSFRNLDQVFLEISAKWDQLSMGQQRYIATMAAGSRQQSRFIALMGNHERLMELVDGANNSAGASQEQFNKTLDSFATKANKLKNAWDQFTMGLLNDKLLKGAVDGLTGFMTVINKIIDGLSSITGPFKGITKSILTLVTVMGSLSVARKGLAAGVSGAFNWFSGKTTMAQMFNNTKAMVTAGTMGGDIYLKSLSSSISKGTGIKEAIQNVFNQRSLAVYQNPNNFKFTDTLIKNQLMGLSAGEIRATQDNIKMIGDGLRAALANTGKFESAGALDEFVQDIERKLKLIDTLVQHHHTKWANKLREKIEADITTKGGNLDTASTAQLVTGFDAVQQSASNAGSAITQLGFVLQNTPLAPFGSMLMMVGRLMTGIVGVVSGLGKALYTAGAAWAVHTGLVEKDTLAVEGNTAAKLKNLLVSTFKGAGGGLKGLLAIGKLILPLAKIAVVIGAIVLAVKALNYQTDKLKDLHKKAAAASDAYKSVKQEVSELKEQLSNLEENDTAFESLVNGTAEFNQKLIESNELVSELIKKYPELQSKGYITTDQNGRMNITQGGRDYVRQEAERRQANAQALDILANADYQRQQARTSKEYRTAERKQSDKAATSGYNYYYGFKTVNEKKYQQAINELSTSGEKTTQSIMAAAEAKAKTQQKIAVSSMLASEKDLVDKNAVSQVIGENYEQLVEAIKADSSGKERAEAYAKAYGYEYISGNKFRDKEGNEQEIEKDIWNDETTNKRIKANEQIVSSAETVDRTLDGLNSKVANAFDDVQIKSDTLISDVLSSNIETNQEDLKTLLEKGNIDKLVNDLTQEQKDALAEAGIDNLSAALEERGQKILEAQQQQDENLAIMMAKATGQNADWLNSGTRGAGEQIKAIRNQLYSLNTEEKNLLNTVGQGLSDNLGEQSMSKFVNTFVNGTQTVRNKLTAITKDVDWSSSISALGAITKMTKSTVPEVKKLGQEIRSSAEGSHLLSDSMQEMFAAEDFTKATENIDNFVNSSGRIDATGIQKMAQESSTLNKLLKTGAISAGGLGAALTATVVDGKIDITSLNDAVLQLLSSFTQLDTAMAEAHDIVSNFDPGIDTGESEDFIKEAYEKAHEYIKNGEWGNEQLENYMRLIVGDDTWTNALAKNNGDLEKTVKHLEPVLNNFKDGFLEGWRDLGNGIDAYGNKIEKIDFNNEHQDKLKVTRQNGKIDFNIKEAQATTEETLEWIEKSYKVSSEMAKLMLADFKNYSPDLTKELEANDFNAGIANGDFYKNNTVKTAEGTEVITLSTSTIKAIAEGSGKSIKEIKDSIVQNAEDQGNKNIAFLTNTYQKGEKKGELIDNYKLLNKRLSNLNEGKDENAKRKEDTNLAWLNRFTKDNKVNMEKALSYGERMGLDKTQTQGMLYEAFQKLTQEGKEFEYNGEVIDPSEINSLGEFIDRLTKIDENENWNEVGRAIAAGYVAYMNEKDNPKPEPEPEPEPEPKKPEPVNFAGPEKKPTPEQYKRDFTTVPVSGGSILVPRAGVSANLKPEVVAPAFQKPTIPKINPPKGLLDFIKPVIGEASNFIQPTTNSGALDSFKQSGNWGTIINWFKDRFGPEKTYAGTDYGTTIPGVGRVNRSGDVITPNASPKNYKQTNDDSIKLDNSIKRLGKTTKGTTTQVNDTTNKYKGLNKAQKEANNGLQKTANTTKTNSKTISKNLAEAGKTGAQKLQEALSKTVKESPKSKKGEAKVSIGTEVKNEEVAKLQKKLKQADVKIKVKTEDKELQNTNKSVKNLQKTGKKGITVKTKVKNNSIQKAENAIKNVGNAAKNVKDADVKVKTTADLGGVNKIQKAAKVTQRMPVTSIEAPGARTAINTLHSLASKSETFSVSVKAGNKQNFTVTVKAAAKGMNNHYTTEHFSLASLGSLAAGSRKGRIGPKDKGGLTLTGEEGYEVAWLPHEGKSMILGAQGPEMLNLPSDAVVWNHKQSKKIVKRKQFSGGTAAIGAGSAATRDDGTSYVVTNSSHKKSTTGGGKKKPKTPPEELKWNSKQLKYIVSIGKLLKKAGRISTWWENITKQIEGAERLASQNQEKFEKVLSNVGSTFSTVSKSAQQYSKFLKYQIKYNEKIFDTYDKQLKKLANGNGLSAQQRKTYIANANSNSKLIKKNGKKKRVGGALGELNKLQVQLAAAEKTSSKKDDKAIKDQIKILKNSKKYKNALKRINKYSSLQTVSWDQDMQIRYMTNKKYKKGKNKGKNIIKTTKTKVKQTKAIDFSSIIYRDPDTGEYLINDKKINKKGRPKAERVAIKEKAQKLVDEKNKRRNDAEDKIRAAREALAKIADDTYQMFNRWEKSITEIYLISQRLEALQSKEDVYKAEEEYLSTKVLAGYGVDGFVKKFTTVLEHERQSIIDRIKTNRALVDATKEEYNKTINFNTYKKEYNADYAKNGGVHSDTATKEYNAAKYAFDILRQTKFFDTGVFDLEKITETFQTYAEKGFSNTTDSEVQKVLDRIQEAQGSYFDALKETYGSVTEIYALLNEYQDYINEFEESLLKGLEEQLNKEIERREKLNTALTNSFKDLLDEVKRRLDERRKKEDNSKTESDISKKQQRLAALRADTSGGHASEIKQLEQEIAEAQQSYGRSLEDQLLEKLQHQGDEAAKQRERQIKLLETERDLAQATGTNLKQVREWLTDPEHNKEQIKAAWLANKNYDEALPKERETLEKEFEEAWGKYSAYTTEVTELKTLLNGVNEIDNFRTDTVTALDKIEDVLEEDISKPLTGIYSDVLSRMKTKTGAQIQKLTNADAKAIQLGLNRAGRTTKNNRLMGNVESKKGVQGTRTWTDKKGKKHTEQVNAKNGHLNATGTKVASAQGDAVYFQKWDKNTGEATGAVSRADINSNNLKKTTIQNNKAEFKEALKYAIEHQEPGTLINKKLKSIISWLGVANNAYTLKNGAHAHLAANGSLLWGGKKGVYTWDATKKEKPKLTKYDADKFKQVIKKLRGKKGGTKSAKYKEYADALKAHGIKKVDGKKFARGGFADFTGPAWLDGTRAKPEAVLNATDTKNFVALKDVLADVMGHITDNNTTTYGDSTYEININVDHLNNDYDVDKVAKRVEKIITQDASYRNVTAVRNFR